MAKVDTVLIDRNGAMVRINTAEFDSTKHTLWEKAKKQEEKPIEKPIEKLIEEPIEEPSEEEMDSMDSFNVNKKVRKKRSVEEKN